MINLVEVDPQIKEHLYILFSLLKKIRQFPSKDFFNEVVLSQVDP